MAKMAEFPPMKRYLFILKFNNNTAIVSEYLLNSLVTNGSL